MKTLAVFAVNGVLCVATGDNPGSLTPKFVPSENVKHEAETHVATILVPSSAGAFVQARVLFAAPSSSIVTPECRRVSREFGIICGQKQKDEEP